MNVKCLLATVFAVGLTTFGAHALESANVLTHSGLQKPFADKAQKRETTATRNVDVMTTASLKPNSVKAAASKPAAAKSAAAKEGAKKKPAQAGGGVIAKAKTEYSTIISRYAASYGVPVALAHAVVAVESNFRPDARGKAGEVGLMQIKPATARMMGYGGSIKGLFDPETNIKYGMKYLAKAHELGGGATCSTILKYNAGHGARRMNPTSAAYCAKVKRHLGS